MMKLFLLCVLVVMVFGRALPVDDVNNDHQDVGVCADYEKKKQCVNSTFDCQWTQSVGCSAKIGCDGKCDFDNGNPAEGCYCTDDCIYLGDCCYNYEALCVDPGPANCIGGWTECDPWSCTEIFFVNQPAINGGAECEVLHEDMRTCVDDSICNRRELKGVTGELRRKLQDAAADPTACQMYLSKRGCKNNDCFWNKGLGKCQ